MHLTCSHAPETERTNRFNLGYSAGPDVFEVVAHGGADTIHVHSEPPHLPITWSRKSDSIEGEAPSGSTTFDVEPPKLAKVGLMSVYRAKPREYEVRGAHLGIEHTCTVQAYPPDEWRLDFEKIRKPVRDLLGPALFAWNEVVELLVPGVDDLKVRFLEEGEASGVMRVAWEEAPFPTGEGGLADYRAFPHFVFSMKGEPLILAGGTLELSIGSLLKAKKFKQLYDKIPQKIRRVLDAFTATGAVEVSFGGTQTVVVDSPDRSLSIGTPSSSSTMEFEGAFSDGLDISVEDEESGLEASGSLKIVASPTLGVIFDPDAERFGFYLKGSFGPVTGNFTLALPGVDFETGEFEIFGERSVSRREVEFSAEFFKERFGG